MTTDGPPTLGDGIITLRPRTDADADADRRRSFVVEVEGEPVGLVEVQDLGGSTGELSWAVDPEHRGRGYATRAVRLLVAYAFEELGLTRLQARVPRDNERAIRLARRSGLRNEGHVRAAPRSGERDHVLLARLVDDPDPGDRAGFRALLNSFLPRKRVIAQALVRDDAGRVLMCHPTYKDDWDLPGGVVEPHESPRDAAGREVLEELALDLAVGGLLLADWMPPWSGWDDALCLVFDAGRHPASLVSRTVLQAREIRAVDFLTVDQVQERAADYTARRVVAALEAAERGGPPFTESGRPV
ncbi:MAG: NUDIX hydrolase [Lapillicoccus sp.]